VRSLRLVGAAFLFGGLFPLAAPLSAACAAEGPSAVLVVDTEQVGGQHRFCVELPDGSVTGIELIELAGEQHGLQYRFGYGGNVVCQLAGIGYGSDECLKDGPEFWGYWRGDGSGGWDWSSGGGNATTVRDGDVEGWSWGTGNDGSSHPAPPATTFASVCGRPAGGDDGGGDGGDDGEAKGGGSPKGGSDPNDGDRKNAGGSASGSSLEDQLDAAGAAEKAKKAAPSDKNKGTGRAGKGKQDETPMEEASPGPAVEPSATAPRAAPASFTDERSDEVPVGGIVAAVAATLCVGGALFLQRRRSRPPG
jgi:hypothetical protein